MTPINYIHTHTLIILKNINVLYIIQINTSHNEFKSDLIIFILYLLFIE
jgi:hypothetical protein